MLRIGGRGWARACVVGIALIAAGGVQAGKGSEPVRLWVKAAITIAPDGRVTSLAWDEKRDAVKRVVAAIEPRVLAFEFEPGQLNGAPVETETTLSLGLELSDRTGGGMDVRIASAGTGTVAVAMTPPEYPKSALSAQGEGEVVAEVEIAPDGRASVIDMAFRGGTEAHRRQFAKAAVEAIQSWQYRVERVGGVGVSSRMSIPVQFCLGSSRRAWCNGREPVRQVKNGTTAPAGEAVALDSVARLKTDLSPPGT